MASPCLKGVVALIVSHSNSVVNDKAALTLRLTGMGATVASRFSGLVTHIIFRRKPHATEDNRFEEDQALFDLYARIDKAITARPGLPKACIVEPRWIEASLSGSAWASETPYILSRPDSFLHLPHTNTPGSSAGKKRKRRGHQPRPVHKYDLDVAALEFSSTQQMHDEHPQGGGEAQVQQEKWRVQLSDMATCPGSAGDVPAKRSKLAAAISDTRPLSAPSQLESISQALESLNATTADVACGPEDRSLPTKERSLQPKSCNPEPSQGGVSHSGSCTDGRKQIGKENQLPPASAAEAEPGTAALQARTTAARSARWTALPDTPLPGHATPLGQHQQPRAAGPSRGQLSISGLSGLRVQLGSPYSAPAQSPYQQLTIPRLKAASASQAGQTTPARANRAVSEVATATAERPSGLRHGWKSSPAEVRMQPKPKAPAGPMISPAHSAAALRTPATLTIPQLKATPGGQLGRSPLAFPGISPAAAQTPLLKCNPTAGQNGRHAGHGTFLDHSGRSESFAAGIASTPAQGPTAADVAGAHQHSAANPSAQSAARRAFGSPLCIEATPQQSNAILRGHVVAAPAADANTTASVAPIAAPNASREQEAPALANWDIKDTPAVQQPCEAAHQSSTVGPRKNAATASKVSKKVRTSVRSSALQQENSAAEMGQQPAAPVEGRQPLVAMRAGALNQEDSKKGGRRTRSKERQTGSAAAPGSQSLSIIVIAGDADSSASRHRQPVRPIACQMAVATAEVGTNRSKRRGPRKAGSMKPATGSLCLSSVSEADAKVAASMVMRLGGMRMCEEGAEGGMTHLVLGSPRRTLKVLLGIAAGAWLLTPKWLAASAAAERWLDEHGFEAETPFAAAAARAREHAARSGTPLLAGKAVHILRRAEAGVQGACVAEALTQVALAHGAKVVGLRQCEISIVCKGCVRTDRLNSPLAVSESWLLDLAARFEVPELSEAYNAFAATC